MIRPKYTFTFYYYACFCALLLCVQILIVKGLVNDVHEIYQVVFLLFFEVILLFFSTRVVLLFVRNARLASINTSEMKITCHVVPFCIQKTYDYCELDGYATGRLKPMLRGEDRLNKVVMLVKGNYVVEFFDERFIDNIAELEEAIKELKYVGYQNFNRIKRWRLLLGILKVDQLELQQMK